jgi:hypothetical protein
MPVPFSKKTIILFVLLCTSIVGFSQIQTQTVQEQKSVFKYAKSKYISFSTNLYGQTNYNGDGYFMPTINLQAAYAPIAKLYIGWEARYSYLWTIPKTTSYHFIFTGPAIRYSLFGKKNNFYLETGYRLSNLALNKKTIDVDLKFHNQYIPLGCGVAYKFNSNIYISTSYTWLRALKKDNATVYDWKLGIEYHINPNHKDPPLPTLDSLKNKTGRFSLMLGFAYLPFDSASFKDNYRSYQNTTKVGYYFTDYLSAGLYLNTEVGKSDKTQNQWFFSTGPYVNVKIFSRKRFGWYMEPAFIVSNQVLTEIDNTLLSKGVGRYIQYAVGVNAKITKNLILDMGGHTAWCLASSANCKGGNIGGYRIGLEYVFKKRLKE